MMPPSWARLDATEYSFGYKIEVGLGYTRHGQRIKKMLLRK
jgi:hypothetical protein